MASITTNQSVVKKDSASTTISVTPSGKSKNVYPTTIEGKIAYADDLNSKGKTLYSEKKYKKAAKIYAQIPTWVSPFCKGKSGEPSEADQMSAMMGGDSGPQATPAQEYQVSQLLRKCHQNRAMCYVKLKKADKVLESCKKSLKYGDGAEAWKVYRAQAEAYILKKDIDNARKAVENTLKNQGGTDKRTTMLLNHVDKMEKNYEKKERKKYAGMFNK